MNNFLIFKRIIVSISILCLVLLITRGVYGLVVTHRNFPETTFRLLLLIAVCAPFIALTISVLRRRYVGLITISAALVSVVVFSFLTSLIIWLDGVVQITNDSDVTFEGMKSIALAICCLISLVLSTKVFRAIRRLGLEWIKDKE